MKCRRPGFGAYIDNAGKMLDFLEAHGGPVFQCVNYADYHMDLAGAKQNRSHETRPMSAGQLGGDYQALQPIHPGAQGLRPRQLDHQRSPAHHDPRPRLVVEHPSR